MPREVHELLGSDAKRHGETVTLIAAPCGDPGHIYRQHQHLVTGGLGPVHQVPGGVERASDIELEPGERPGQFLQGLQVGRGGGGDTMRDAALDGLCSQQPVCARPSQVAHSHGRDAKGQRKSLAQKTRGQTSLLGRCQYAGH